MCAVAAGPLSRLVKVSYIVTEPATRGVISLLGGVGDGGCSEKEGGGLVGRWGGWVPC